MTTNEENTQQSKKRKRKWIIAGCVIAVGVLLMACGVYQLIQLKWPSKPATSRYAYTADAVVERVAGDSEQVPVFSADSGFYDEGFELAITAAAGEIYYTLDGSDPAGSSSARLYEKPIKIYNNTEDRNILSAERDIVLGHYIIPFYKVDKGMIIRAAVKDESGSYGKTVTKSYFVGKTEDYYHDMKVISLVTNPYNLFDPDEGIYVVGSGYYEWKKSPEYNPAYEDWRQDNPTNYNRSGKKWERPAVVQVFEQGKPVYEQDVAIRLAGNVSRSNAQKSIRLYAREEYGDKRLRYTFFDGLTDINGKPIEKFDKVTLRNDGNDTTSAFFRDELVQSLCADRAVGVQAEEPCILFIDGEFWGMYHIKERIDAYYIASHYDVDKANVTYVKCSETEGSEDIRQEYEDFFKWAMSADLSQNENYQKVADTIDLQSLMDYFAIETYINNYDWLYAGRHPNNILMWRVNEKVDGNIYGDGRWRFVLYDMEYSSNLYGQEGTKPEYDSFKNINKENEWMNIGALFFRLLNNDTFRSDFYENYLEVMDECFDPDRVNAWIDEYCGDNYYAISDTFRRFQGDNSGLLDYHIETVRDFYNRRPEYARQYLNEVCER